MSRVCTPWHERRKQQTSHINAPWDVGGGVGGRREGVGDGDGEQAGDDAAVCIVLCILAVEGVCGERQTRHTPTHIPMHAHTHAHTNQEVYGSTTHIPRLLARRRVEPADALLHLAVARARQAQQRVVGREGEGAAEAGEARGEEEDAQLEGLDEELGALCVFEGMERISGIRSHMLRACFHRSPKRIKTPLFQYTHVFLHRAPGALAEVVARDQHVRQARHLLPAVRVAVQGVAEEGLVVRHGPVPAPPAALKVVCGVRCYWSDIGGSRETTFERQYKYAWI